MTDERDTKQGRQQRPSGGGGAIQIEVSPGELFDKISILQIKAERITDPAALEHVRRELAMLEQASGAIVQLAALRELRAQLKSVNEALWDVEDEIRRCDAAGDFGPRFVELAQAVYHHNDRRAHVKRQINEMLGSRIAEQKTYGG